MAQRDTTLWFGSFVDSYVRFSSSGLFTDLNPATTVLENFQGQGRWLDGNRW